MIKMHTKGLVLLFILVCTFQIGKAQIVRGTISDKSDNLKINFASIYINGTTVGTLSKQDGSFELDITKYSSLPLTVSALGYYTVTLTDFPKDKPIDVYLVQKTFQLNEVVVAAKSTRDRIKNMKLFRDQFLGSGYNGHNCVIMNDKDIIFDDSSHDTLKAIASKPIIIVNNALGYKITYYLDKFEYNLKTKSFLYEGSALFNEDMSGALTSKNLFEKRRKITYLGSRSHFFTSLWTNSLKSSGFSIINPTDEDIEYEDIVKVRSGFKKYISSKDNLIIYYMSKTPSCFEPLKDQIFFDSNGYFDGSGIKVTGQMAQQRIGDLLPYDFRIK